MEARISRSVARELAHILRDPLHAQAAFDGPLRVGARILSRASAGEMTTTTVVGVLGPDDVDGFRALVGGITEEYGLQASLRLKTGSYSVSFRRPPTDVPELSP